MTFAGKLHWKRHKSPLGILLFAHGAGADTSHPWYGDIRPLLESAGWRVVFLDFAYRVKGRKAPDRLPILQDTFRVAADRVAKRAEGLPLFLAGKSMGGRVATTLLAEPGPWQGALVFGYPLFPPGKPEKARERAVPLKEAKARVAILQGSRDSFGSKRDLAKAAGRRRQLKFWDIKDGDHSLNFTKKSGRLFPQDLEQPIQCASEWLLGK